MKTTILSLSLLLLVMVGCKKDSEDSVSKQSPDSTFSLAGTTWLNMQGQQTSTYEFTKDSIFYTIPGGKGSVQHYVLRDNDTIEVTPVWGITANKERIKIDSPITTVYQAYISQDSLFLKRSNYPVSFIGRRQ